MFELSECRYTRQLAASGVEADETAGVGGDGTKVLGTDPETALEVTLRVGRFGPYVQLGEGEKPKRSSLPKGWEAATLDLDAATLKLLGLPREVGLHPETGKPIIANIGRFGPYLQHDGAYANLGSVDEVFDVGINRRRRGHRRETCQGSGWTRRQTGPKGSREHPTLTGSVKVLDGKYGPYVNHAKTNATLPKGMDPQSVTMEAAVALLAEREAKSPTKPVRAAKAAPKTASKAKPKVDAGDDSDPLRRRRQRRHRPRRVASKKPAAKAKPPASAGKQQPNRRRVKTPPVAAGIRSFDQYFSACAVH